MSDPFEKYPELPLFTLTSATIADGRPMPANQVANSGVDEASPQLSWSGFPEGTQSFAITGYDPDAPTQSGFWHWAVADLPVSVTSLEEGASAGLGAPALTLRNDAGTAAFIGAAPPAGHGPHRYFFTVWAVDVPTLGLAADTTPARLGFALFQHALGRATIHGTHENLG